MKLFFDTETSGLPNFKARNSDPSQPYILQLAAILCTDEGEIIEEFCTLVKPANSNPIHPKAYEAHGISREQCDTEGMPYKEAYSTFMSIAAKASTIIAHNLSFDTRLLGIMSAQVTGGSSTDDPLYMNFKNLPGICTMQSTISYCALPFPSGRKGFKYPKLEELYFKLHGVPMSDNYSAHDALGDVRCTKDCYYELVKRGHYENV